MRYTIKARMFITFLITLGVTVLFAILFSNLFLDDFVISANKRLIENTFDDNQFLFEYDGINEEKLTNLSNKNNIGIVIYQNDEVLSCNSTYICLEDNVPSYITKYFPYIKEGDSRSYTLNYELLNVHQLIYIYNMGDGKYVLLDKSLESITEINSIIRPFILYSSLVVLLIGTFIIYILSNRLSKPLTEISHFAQKIAELDFDERINVKNKGEIGLLAQHMNQINEELKKALDSLKDDLEKEKEYDRKRVKYFSTVSHELKTPITIIQGYVEGLRYNIAKDPETMNEYLDIITSETKKMSKLISDLLNLSLYESGHFKLNKGDFDLIGFIYDVSNKYIDSIKDKKIQFEIINDHKDLWIHADKYRLEQVVLNFLSNAVKYIDDNGIIRITIMNKKDNVVLKFFNNGDLIPESEINSIWSIFYKLEDNDKNNIGTGLGLATIKSIIELHEGTYGVINKEDGVEFFVSIPKK